MSKDDSTWLNICYVLFALAASYVAFKGLYSVGLQVGWTERYDEWFPAVNNALAVVFGAFAAFWLQSSKERREYHLSAISELRKVTWPTMPETKRMTLIVAIVVVVCSIIMTIFDVAWSKVLQSILP